MQKIKKNKFSKLYEPNVKIDNDYHQLILEQQKYDETFLQNLNNKIQEILKEDFRELLDEIEQAKGKKAQLEEDKKSKIQSIKNKISDAEIELMQSVKRQIQKEEELKQLRKPSQDISAAINTLVKNIHVAREINELVEAYDKGVKKDEDEMYETILKINKENGVPEDLLNFYYEKTRMNEAIKQYEDISTQNRFLDQVVSGIKKAIKGSKFLQDFGVSDDEYKNLTDLIANLKKSNKLQEALAKYTEDKQKTQSLILDAFNKKSSMTKLKSFLVFETPGDKAWDESHVFYSNRQTLEQAQNELNGLLQQLQVPIQEERIIDEQTKMVETDTDLFIRPQIKTKLDINTDYTGLGQLLRSKNDIKTDIIETLNDQSFIYYTSSKLFVLSLNVLKTKFSFNNLLNKEALLLLHFLTTTKDMPYTEQMERLGTTKGLLLEKDKTNGKIIVNIFQQQINNDKNIRLVQEKGYKVHFTENLHYFLAYKELQTQQSNRVFKDLEELFIPQNIYSNINPDHPIYEVFEKIYTKEPGIETDFLDI
jgi:hypothetical protein